MKFIEGTCIVSAITNDRPLFSLYAICFIKSLSRIFKYGQPSRTLMHKRVHIQIIYISVCEYMTEPLIKNLKLLWN